MRATIPGPGKIMTYEDIARARRVLEEKEAGVAMRKQKRAAKSLPETTGKSAHEAEVAVAKRQIAAAGLSEHCGVSVLFRFLYIVSAWEGYRAVVVGLIIIDVKIGL